MRTGDDDVALAEKYVIGELLGEGGSSAVYRAVEAGSDRALALKRLRSSDPRERARFEREFHALCQLSHPGIIRVHDFGVDDEDRPYFTMDLLPGRELREHAPMPWAEACALLREVASSLSLIHQRRLIHRDLSTRNIRCDAAGRALLIDFGSMVPEGTTAECVGTPPFVAPEALRGEPLSPRTDLYALGAVAYYLLLGRHAYPARRLLELADLWRSRPPLPSRVREEIPVALSELVMSLLSLDPYRRPTGAWEVIERLRAIASLPPSPAAADVQRAYLARPVLVGREELMHELRPRILGLLRAQGTALLVRGEPGMGCSRMLDACALEGQLVGAQVLRAEGSDALGDYGVARALIVDLLQSADDATLAVASAHAATLGSVVPELAERLGIETPEAPLLDRGDHQRGLLSLMLELARTRALFVAVDDFESCDDPSAAFVAQLALLAPATRVAVVVSAPLEATIRAPAAFEALRSSSVELALLPLTDAQTEELVRSIFGDVPHVASLAARLHALSNGNPGACVSWAESLLERGVVRYVDGRFALPERIDERRWPRSLEQALEDRLQGLSDDARQLASALALCGQRLALEDYVLLTTHGDARRLYQSLSELCGARVLSGTAHGYAFTHGGWSGLFTRGTSPEERRALELRLGRLLAARGAHPVLVIHHMFRAGQREEALDRLVYYLETLTVERVTIDATVVAYTTWTFEEGLRVCEELGRSPRESFMIRMFLAGMSMYLDPELAFKHGPAIEVQLRRDTGLVHWTRTDSELSDARRVQQCLDWAEAERKTLPLARRGLHPRSALLLISRYVLFALGPFGTMFDTARLSGLVDLIAPVREINPVLGVVHDVACATWEVARARTAQAEASFLQVLERLSSPESAKLPEVVRRTFRHVVLYALAQSCCSRNEPRVMEWLRELDSDPMQQINAWRVRRQMHLYRGERDDAADCQARIDALTLQRRGARTLEGGTAFTDTRVAVLAGDLAQLRRCRATLARLSERHRSYAPIQGYGEGMYKLLCGDAVAGIAILERSLAQVAPGEHPMWGTLVDDYLAARFEREGAAAVRSLCAGALSDCERLELDSRVQVRLLALLGLCEAELGIAAAIARVRQAVSRAEAEAHAPLQIAEVYRRAASAALAFGHGGLFEDYARCFGGICKQTRSASLGAQYERLMASARRLGPQSAERLDDLVFEQLGHSRLALDVRRALGACEGPVERRERALALLIEQCNAHGGYLYGVMPDGTVRLLVSNGAAAPPAEVSRHLRQLIAEEQARTEANTATEAREESVPTLALSVELPELGDGALSPVLLEYDNDGQICIAAVALLFGARHGAVPWAFARAVGAALRPEDLH